MRSIILRLLPVFAATLYPCAMGFFFLLCVKPSPDTGLLLSAALTSLMAVSFLGCAVMVTIGIYEHRFREIERRLREAELQAENREATTSADR